MHFDPFWYHNYYLIRFTFRFQSEKSLFQIKRWNVLMCRLHSFKGYVKILAHFFSLLQFIRSKTFNNNSVNDFILDFGYPFSLWHDHSQKLRSFMFYKLPSNLIESNTQHMTKDRSMLFGETENFQFNFVVNWWMNHWPHSEYRFT